MLSGHSRDQVVVPLSIIPPAKAGHAIAGHGAPNPILAAEVRIQ